MHIVRIILWWAGLPIVTIHTVLGMIGNKFKEGSIPYNIFTGFGLVFWLLNVLIFKNNFFD